MVDLNFNPAPEPICKNCGRKKSTHKAVTFNCSFGRSPWYQFYDDRFFVAREQRKKK